MTNEVGDFQRLDRLELKLGKKYIKSEHIGKKPVCFFYAQKEERKQMASAERNEEKNVKSSLWPRIEKFHFST